jgi:hypothetical protein
MIRRRAALLAAATVAVALGCTQTKRLADWSGDSGTGDDVIPMDCGACAAEGGEIENLRCALDLCDPTVVLNGDGEYAAVTGTRSPGMAETCALADTRQAVLRFGDSDNGLAPKLNGSYAILATGDWDAAYHDTSCSPHGATDADAGANEQDDYGGSGEMYDAVEWRLVLRAPSNAKSFSFDYVFFSAEYDEGISGQYNDKFYVLIEAASANHGEPTVINYTACRDESAYYDFTTLSGTKACYIAINSALSECCWYGGCTTAAENTDVGGTAFECAADPSSDSAGTGSSTGWLRTVWPIDPGEVFTLTFHVHDTGDSTRDSAAIVDAFQFHRSFTGGGTVVVE